LELVLSAIPPVPPRRQRLPSLAAALLYAALGVSANPAPAGEPGADAAARIEALKAGEMRKLVVHATPVAAADVAFTDLDGAEHRLADSNGRVRLVNFWATWCAPCREEMPALDALARARGGADFEVIAIATGRNNLDAIARFKEEHDITALPTLLDAKGALAAAMNVPGLPVTVLLDRDGAEVARMLGGADWNGPEAHAVIDALIAAE
jgi:thiol-disulfide isomerase/thioredoxin